MTPNQQAWAELSQEEARHRLLLNFDKVIHDMHCMCGKADIARAALGLERAGWTLTQLFEVWHEAWMAGQFDA